VCNWVRPTLNRGRQIKGRIKWARGSFRPESLRDRAPLPQRSTRHSFDTCTQGEGEATRQQSARRPRSRPDYSNRPLAPRPSAAVHMPCATRDSDCDARAKEREAVRIENCVVGTGTCGADARGDAAKKAWQASRRRTTRTPHSSMKAPPTALKSPASSLVFVPRVLFSQY